MIPTRRPRWLSPLTLAYGIVVFLWLTPEENSVISVTLLGVGGALLAGLHLAYRLRPVRHGALIGIGALAGASASLITALLMFLKTAVHAHLFPDYPPLLLIGILERLPTWTVAGGLLGGALALLLPGPARHGKK